MRRRTWSVSGRGVVSERCSSWYFGVALLRGRWVWNWRCRYRLLGWREVEVGDSSPVVGLTDWVVVRVKSVELTSQRPGYTARRKPRPSQMEELHSAGGGAAELSQDEKREKFRE